VIKNTLEFDPQILKRYVNFMNNPDERTAVDQFGDGDKYFGVATVMAAMPGLPMFGHGQIEGFAERYGMEYRRAYVDESPDAGLIARHEREIFPLLHRRHLFAEVEDFAMYDFFTADGAVNEDVYAFSNSRDGQRSLVVYHNRYAETAGWIRTAAVTGRSLASGLGLGGGAEDYLVLRDGRTDLVYLRSESELAEHGLYLQLGGYACHVFVEMESVHDTDGRYAQLAAYLAGRGVPSLDEAMKELNLAPLHAAVREQRTDDALREAAALLGVEDGAGKSRAGTPDRLESFVSTVRPDLSRGAWIYEWRLDRVWPDADLIAIKLDKNGAAKAPPPDVRTLLRDDRFKRSIGVNEHDGGRYFNKERFEKAIETLGVTRRAELRRLAERSGYRIDELERLLSEPPKWASTRRPPPLPAKRPRAKAAAARTTARKRPPEA
jgi:hypothetical protein